MENGNLFGACMYCGEITLKSFHKDTTINERNTLATDNCDCNEALKAKQIKKAKARVLELFGEKAEKYGFEPIKEAEIIDILFEAIGLVANSKMLAMNIQITGITSAKLSISGKGKINIERKETSKYKLEE